MAHSQRDGHQPYHSIDLEAAPSPLHDPHDKEERMPLSPRASPGPQLQKQQASVGPQGPYPPAPGYTQTSTQNGSKHKNNGSWDVLGGIAKDWNEFDTRNASQSAFQYAEGTAAVWSCFFHCARYVFSLLTLTSFYRGCTTEPGTVAVVSRGLAKLMQFR